MNFEISKLTLAVNEVVNNGADIIVVAGIKGGGGKTVTCQTIVTALVDLGYKVLYVDLDQQKTGVYWWNRRVDYIEAMLAELKSRRAKTNDTPDDEDGMKGLINDMLADLEVMEGLAKYQMQKDIDKYHKFMKMRNLIAVGLTPQIDGWDEFNNVLKEDSKYFDYIVIDTPGHFDDIEIQKNVFKKANLVVVPTKSTMVDLEQMPKNAELVKAIRKNNNLSFKAVSVVLLKDASKNQYNDYSVLDGVSDTLPVLSLDGENAVLFLKSIGNKANEVGCTAIEYGYDKDEQFNISKFGCAIINELSNNQ